MENLAELKAFFTEGYLHYRPNLSVDCVIFGYHEEKLRVLLVKNKLTPLWCLPGGYVKKNESLENAADRVTEQRSGIENLFLKQFRAFSDPKRNQNNSIDINKLIELTGITHQNFGWLEGPVVTVGFYAITDVVNTKPTPDFLSSECAWFSINDLPKLGFDHNEIVRDALNTMRMDLYHFPIGKSLLPHKFTLKEIRMLYEVLSGKKLNASNFPNKLIALKLIRKTKEKLNIGAHRSPTFYTFNDKVYEKALQEGLVLV